MNFTKTEPLWQKLTTYGENISNIQQVIFGIQKYIILLYNKYLLTIKYFGDMNAY